MVQRRLQIAGSLIFFLTISMLLVFTCSQGQSDSLSTLVKPKVGKGKKSMGNASVQVVQPVQSPCQIDSPIYEIQLKTGQNYYCNIISMSEGSFMTIKNCDGATHYMQWDDINSYHLTCYNSHSTQLADEQKREEMKLKYASWDKCCLLHSIGDTVKGWIKYNEDLSSNTVYEQHGKDVVVADEITGTERTYKMGNWFKLIIFGRDTTSFLCIYTDADYERKGIFKILVDGPCYLLYNEWRVDGGFMSSGGTGTAYMTPQDREKYSIYYKGIYTKLRAESQDNPAMPSTAYNFKKKCQEIFAECPALVTKIDSKIFRSDNLREIVKEFNECLNNK